MSAGQRILDGLKDAIAGNFAAVTIGGQRWIRSDVQAGLVEALEHIDALAVRHEAGAIGKAQKIARAALEKAKPLNVKEQRG